MAKTILAESHHYLITSEYETVWLEIKESEREANKEYVIDDHYGDAVCGIIDPAEKWCCVAGEGVLLYDLENMSVCSFLRARPDMIHDMKLTREGKIKILVDPWSSFPATWLLDPRTKSISKLKDGPDLRGEEYRESIEF